MKPTNGNSGNIKYTKLSNAAKLLGSKGGVSKSPAKKIASRENGKLGGKPKGK